MTALNAVTRARLVLAKPSVVALLLLALLAFVPSQACACLQTYRFSPARMVLAAQLFGLLLVIAAAVPAGRIAGALLGFFVLIGSWFGAMVAAGLGHSAVMAGVVAVAPVYLVAGATWFRNGSGNRCKNRSAEDAAG